ncbi:hypothetical protein [Nostoc sp. LPT]|uniref:hypothetical protein n=1 Tax=Nostoc sp. LPT TaxID=2815387 RepID=UPI001D78840F|nr:hypothetical protein [Nostoc sp. LPT]MBN4004694.1 hypothetical protein [Nostoc sp. LPT]
MGEASAKGFPRHLTPVASSRETLSAVPPGGNPQDRTASPQRWLLYAGEPVHRSGSP